MTIVISRLYDDYATAQQVVRDLESAGLRSNDISIVASNADNWYEPAAGKRKIADRKDTDHDGTDDRVEGAEAGAGIGAAVGAAGGLLAGLGLLAIPGIGPVVAAGWLAATATGAVAGGAAGGAIGALTQAGISKDDAPVYAEGLRRGLGIGVADLRHVHAIAVRPVDLVTDDLHGLQIEEVALAQELAFAAPRRGAAHHRTPPNPLCLLRQDGRELHVQVHAHYGARSGAWYTTVAELDSAVEADDAEPLFNVEPYLVAPMALTVKRSLRGHSAGRATVTGHAASGKTLTFTREAARWWLEHAERHLGQDES